MLELAPGVGTAEVSYEITGNGMTPLVGTIPVTDPASAVAAQIGGLNEGSGYLIELAATSMDGAVECTGQGEFTIVAGEATTASIELECRAPGDDGNGGVGINVCPTLVRAVATPVRAGLGEELGLNALASDVNPGDMLVYHWDVLGVTSGTLEAPSAQRTRFVCTELGQVTLRASVSDGRCSRNQSIVVTCAEPLCGNGTLDGTETCDDHNTLDQDLCPADCRVACGDGAVEGAESCEPSLLPSCRSDCTLSSCGDGVVDPGEACDDGNLAEADGCNARCQEPLCGDGVVEGSEECDDGNAIDADTCTSECVVVNVCPTLPEIIAAPPAAAVGEDIDVSASSADANGDALTFAWGATSGNFEDPSAPATRYSCAVAGTHTLSVTVTDARSCARSRTRNVTCQ